MNLEMNSILFFLCLFLLLILTVGLFWLTRKDRSANQNPLPWFSCRRRTPTQYTEEDISVEISEDTFSEVSVSEELPVSTEVPAAPTEELVPKSRTSALGVVALVLTLILMAFGLLDALEAVDFVQYHNGFFLMGITAALEYLCCGIFVKKPSRVLRFAGKLLIVASILEVTIFQFPSYHLLFGNYSEKVLMPSEAIIEQGNNSFDSESNTILINGKEETVLTFENIQQPIGTIRVVAKCGENTEHSKVIIDMTDETHASYRYDAARTDLIEGRDNTQYISCQFSGDVDTIRVKFTNYNDGDQVLFQRVQLNVPIPFIVSPLRLCLILGLGLFAYAIVCSVTLRKPYLHTVRFCRSISILMTSVAVFLACAIVITELPDEGIAGHLKLKSGNQITQELVDAFENGQISLLDEPSEALLQLENPYDWGLRSDNGVDAKWDHVLYDGKYYSYYGIAPVLLLYLPYHKLTGYYCSTNLSILLFSAIGLIFLTMTYLAFVKRWARKVSAGCVLAGLAILQSVCGIWFSVGRNLFYEISISSGFAFTMIGAYCLISSNILSKGKISLIRTAFASLCLGIAVLCRPTLAVYAIVAVVYFLYAIPKSGHTLQAGSVMGVHRGRQIGYICCAALPLAALGVLQMWYNYARFDSPFDFGIQYSLTINDFVNAQYHTHFVLIGIWNYLFAAPSFNVEYPFVTTPFSKMDVNGYYFSDSGNTSGILFLALPVFGYLLTRKALRLLPNRKARIKSAVAVGLPCLLMPLVIICSIWESGYAVRYTADFSWQITLGALAILFFLYQRTKNQTKKAWFHRFMAFSAVYAILVNGIQIFNFTFPQADYPALCDHLTQLIAFWK